MIFNLKKLTLVLAFLAMSSLTYAENRNSVIIKTGSFTLANKDQNIDGAVTFDTTSSSVVAIEYEYKMKKDLSWGAEYIRYQNTFASGIGTGTANFTHIMFNIRKLFEASKHIQPFFGIGAGGSTAALGGDYIGIGGGFGFQAMAGVKFPFESLSAVIEYKAVFANPDDEGGTSINSSGNGFFAGIGLSF